MFYSSRKIIILLMLSLASMMSNVQARNILTDASAQTVTRNVPVLVKHIPKPKLFRSNPLRKSLIMGGADPSDTIDDEDYIVNTYRRPLEIKKPKVDDDLSDYVKFRLFLARQLAMMKYNKKWA